MNKSLTYESLVYELMKYHPARAMTVLFFAGYGLVAFVSGITGFFDFTSPVASNFYVRVMVGLILSVSVFVKSKRYKRD